MLFLEVGPFFSQILSYLWFHRHYNHAQLVAAIMTQMQIFKILLTFPQISHIL